MNESIMHELNMYFSQHTDLDRGDSHDMIRLDIATRKEAGNRFATRLSYVYTLELHYVRHFQVVCWW